MIRLLVHGDYVCNTGFGNVMRNIVKNLYDTGDFEVDIVGVNYNGDPYDNDKWPGRVYPALKSDTTQNVYMDVFGRQRVLDLLATNSYDVVFILQDTFVVKEYIDALVETCQNVNTKIVYYYPIDAIPDPSWITDVVAKVDYPITFTNYAKAETINVDPSLKNKLEVIYHGTNTNEFYPLKDDGFREKYFNKLADKFIIMNLNRNQPRKDILRSLLVLKELKDRGRDVLLYLHMQGNDVGGNIKQWGDQLGLKYREDYAYPAMLGNGFPVDLINKIYNAVDCVLSTTHGEGWGLSITEAMATKTPIVAPDVTSLTEMLANNRGVLVPSGKTNNDWYTVGHQDNNRVRPLMSVQDGAKAIEALIDGQLPDIDGAYQWAISQDWTTKAKEFERIIRKASEKPQIKLNREQRRKLARVK